MVPGARGILMNEQLNVAIIGCGGISRSHLPNLLNTPTLRLVATMDVIEGAARERAEQGDAQYWTTDYDRVLADDDIDAVLICATHSTHTDLTLQALSAGKHVYVEKPPSMTIEEAKSVQQASHETGLHVMSGWWFKHSPITKRLREVITEPRFILFTCRIPTEQRADRPPSAPRSIRFQRHPRPRRIQPSLDLARDALTAGRDLRHRP